MEQQSPPASSSTTVTSTTPLLPQNHPWWHRHFHMNNSLSSELSGAVGDLGTFIPIVLTLTLVSHLDLSTTLIFTALYNITTGLLFHIPMPVQPMKSIAAVAVSETPHLTTSQIATAGASTAAVLFFLGATGLMSTLYRLLPLPVVRGIQLSQGLSFAFSAIKYIRYNQDFVASKATTPRAWLGLDGLVVALSSLLFLVIFTGSGDHYDRNGSDDDQPRRRNSKRLRILGSIPAALIVFLLGLVLCFIRDPSIFGDIKFGPSKIGFLSITWNDWKVGFLKGAVPQIPLSVLNSVIAVYRELSAAKVSVSVGVMNLVGCWFGAMPVCHGAGSSAALGFVCGILLFLLLKLRKMEYSGSNPGFSKFKFDSTVDAETSSIP
uniref:SLC26A/SulP transporter domain-containing protein n=1 Tax=Gossypium raimondii TaxID=29730 RepID=A0A0D2RIN7_GOSRA|nr:hypothetical protein B456_011G079400 [Gossypium raimondii]